MASGVYRIIDSAENWTRMEDGLPPISTFGATGIVIDNSDPDITYTAFWDIPYTRAYTREVN